MARSKAAWAAKLFRERTDLLRMLRCGGGASAVLVAGHVLTAAWPTLGALATGWLTIETVDVLAGRAGAGAVVPPLGALAALMLVDEVSLTFRDAVQRMVAGRLDGHVLREVRRLIELPRGVGHLESPEYADDVSRASEIGPGAPRSPGAAAVGQLTLTFRMLSALAAAALLARFSVPLAAVLLIASLVIRATVQRQWMHLAAVRGTRESGARRVRYWSDIAAGQDAAKEIRLFGLAHFVVRRRTGEALAWAGDIWATRRSILARQWLTIGLALVSAAASMLLPGVAALRGELSTGELVTCLVAAGVVFQIGSMGMEAYDIAHGLESVRALAALREREPVRDGTEADRALPTGQSPPAVVIEKLSYRYPAADGPVLDGLDLSIRPGEVLAIVGSSGSGKTTLIKLLAGLHEPTGGRISVNGEDLAQVDPRSWRRRLGVVFQDFNRYPLPLADNITLGAPGHRDDADGAADALRRAQAPADTFPADLTTRLDSAFKEGVGLSGGQWQRVAVARALFAASHGRDLLILDEPTAHLDVEAEADFYRRVVAAVHGATVVLISHRLSTVRHADRIVLLRDGRVAEQGSHDELMAAGGDYARLFRLQAARFGGPPTGDGAPAVRSAGSRTADGGLMTHDTQPPTKAAP